MDGIVIYQSAFDICAEYDTDTQCRLIGYMARYALTGQEPEFSQDDMARFVWPAIREKADRTVEAYEKKAAAGRKGGRTQAEQKQTASRSEAQPKQNTSTVQAEAKQDESKAKPDTETDTDTDTDVKENKAKEKRQRFSPPTLDEVRSYIRERGSSVDPERWFAYYESNGWRVGKNPMRDWRAAVRTWERNELPSGNGHGGKTVVAQQYQQRDYSKEEPEPVPEWMQKRWEEMRGEGTA